MTSLLTDKVEWLHRQFISYEFYENVVIYNVSRHKVRNLQERKESNNNNYNNEAQVKLNENEF